MTAAPKTLAPSANAVMVSDRTCEIVLGVPWRALRTFCGERQIPIGRIGRRPVVSVAAVVAALEGSASTWSEAEVIELTARRAVSR